jgi:hypothetical protein
LTYVPAALRREVIERAGNRCEYCRLPAEVAFYPHEVDHVIAEKHGGTNNIDNLAFACWRCNRHKGSDLTSFDPETALINPSCQLNALSRAKAMMNHETFSKKPRKLVA